MHDELLLQERLHFFQIDGQVRAELPGIWQVIAPVLPDILARFYAHIAAVPSLSAMVGTHQKRLISAQTDHWARLFGGQFDTSYVAGIRRIGLVHHKIGLEPHWYIGGYAFVLGELNRHLATKRRFGSRGLGRQIEIISKAVMLDMGFAISVYQDSLLEERQMRGKVLSEAIDTFSSAVEASLKVSSEASGALSESAVTLDSATSEAAGLAEEVVRAAEQTSANMQTGAAATEELAASVNEIGGQAARSANVARKAVEAAQRTKTSVTELAEQARQIGEVIDLISQIASQTNLLALNATIEAARAGEAGKGFAVVANEVKTLAGQTAKATIEIGRRISAVQQATEQSEADIQEIAGIIDEVSSIAVTIAAAVEEQSVVTTELAATLQQTANHTHQVARSIETLNGSTASASSAVLKVNQARAALNQQMVQLEEEIGGFLKAARAV